MAAGGTDEPGVLGTDAARVMAAIERAMSPDGVLVLMDLGSALMSTELAVDLLGETPGPVMLSEAPLVEGTVAAAAAARGGASLDEVAAEARGALAMKTSQLGGGDDEALLRPRRRLRSGRRAGRARGPQRDRVFTRGRRRGSSRRSDGSTRMCGWRRLRTAVPVEGQEPHERRRRSGRGSATRCRQRVGSAGGRRAARRWRSWPTRGSATGSPRAATARHRRPQRRRRTATRRPTSPRRRRRHSARRPRVDRARGRPGSPPPRRYRPATGPRRREPRTRT